LIVTRLDRLARGTRDLLNVLHIVGERGAAFKSLADHWANTTTPHGRLMVTILGGLAEFERSLIKARTDVGIKRARDAGIPFGRPPKLTPHQRIEALRLLDAGEPQSAVARLLNVDQSTISRLTRTDFRIGLGAGLAGQQPPVRTEGPDWGASKRGSAQG
jgi:DNA invertase Pin-like site-specific DNA recombinase